MPTIWGSMQTTCPMQGQIECQGKVVHVLLMKARDKDRHVQLCAYKMLAETSTAGLHASLGLCQWRGLIETGLSLSMTSRQPQGGP